MEKQPSMLCSDHKMPIQYICFDSQCRKSQKQVMCHKCLEQHHKENERINGENGKDLLISANKFSKHMIIEYCQLKNDLDDFKRSINYAHLLQILQNQISTLKSSVLQAIGSLQEQLIGTITLDLSQGEIVEEQILIGQISTLTQNKLFVEFSKDRSSMNRIQQELTNWSISVAKDIRNHSAEINKVLTKISKQHSDVKHSQINKPFCFSEEWKNRSIELPNPDHHVIRKVTKEGLGSLQFCLCSEPFTPLNNSIRFKIDKMTRLGCISFGACLKQQVAKHLYFRCWQLKEGVYSIFLNTFGQVKSNHNTLKQNSNKLIPWFVMKSGDNIGVEIDFMKEQIIFKINGKKQFSMPVDIDRGDLYPFAAVSYALDQVSIV